MGATIHPSSIVERGAELGEGVEIGPFCAIGPKVRLGDGVKLVSHISIAGSTTIGARTLIRPFTALGQPPQDKGYKGEDTRLIIGADNVLHEQVTMQLGTPNGRQQTVVGDRGFFMVGAHVGHDCIVGDNVTFANNATLGGLVVIDDFVNIGGLCAVHQFGRVGRYAFIGGGAPVTGDVIPFGMVDNHGGLHGLNLVGLKRRGFKRETINALREFYRRVFLDRTGAFDERLEAAAQDFSGVPEAGTGKPAAIERE